MKKMKKIKAAKDRRNKMDRLIEQKETKCKRTQLINNEKMTKTHDFKVCMSTLGSTLATAVITWDG